MVKKPRAKPRGRPFKPTESKKSKILSVRLEPELWEALSARADQAGISISADVLARLLDSLKEQGRRETDEELFADSATKQMMIVLVGQFLFAGARAGAEKFGEKVSREQWMSDQSCFDAAMLSLVMELWRMRPQNTEESTVLWFDRLTSQLLTDMVNKPRRSK